MRKSIFHYFKIAGQIATKREDKRQFYLAALGIRSSDNVIVKSYNGTAKDPTPNIHAEARCVKKLTPNSVMYVARIMIGSGAFGCARPCCDCLSAIKNMGLRKVYYTIGNSRYGVIDFFHNTERVIKENVFVDFPGAPLEIS